MLSKTHTAWSVLSLRSRNKSINFSPDPSCISSICHPEQSNQLAETSWRERSLQGNFKGNHHHLLLEIRRTPSTRRLRTNTQTRQSTILTRDVNWVTGSNGPSGTLEVVQKHHGLCEPRRPQRKERLTIPNFLADRFRTSTSL